MTKADYNSPNTRARVAARRAARRSTRRETERGSLVRPGVRRAFGNWFVTGQCFSLVVLVATLSMLYTLFTSPQYEVQQVEVRGNSALPSNVVADLAGLRGTPIWFVNTQVAVQHLMSSAYIERARIDIALPNKAVITLVERQPDVRWQAGGLQYLVDSGGKVLDVAKEAASPGTLVVQDSSNKGLQPNGQVDPDALTLARRLSLRLPTELKLTPASIGWDVAMGIYVNTASGQRIVFGRTENLDQKLTVLGYLLHDQTPFTYLDLRPANPFYQNDQRPTATSQP